MQEEVTGKSVALIVDGARMSEQVLEKAINAYLDARKNKQPKIYHGKQSLKQLPQWCIHRGVHSQYGSHHFHRK